MLCWCVHSMSMPHNVICPAIDVPNQMYWSPWVTASTCTCSNQSHNHVNNIHMEDMVQCAYSSLAAANTSMFMHACPAWSEPRWFQQAAVFAMATYDGGHCALFNVTLVFSALEHRLPKRLQKQSAMLCILSLFVHACKSCFWYPRMLYCSLFLVWK